MRGFRLTRSHDYLNVKYILHTSELGIELIYTELIVGSLGKEIELPNDKVIRQ